MFTKIEIKIEVKKEITEKGQKFLINNIVINPNTT